MAILTNKPASVSADSTTSLTLNKADLQAKLTALNAGAYWQDQSTWKGVAFLFENANKQKVTASFDASGSTANLNVSEFFVDGNIECKRIDVVGFANDYYTIYRSDFTSASEFDIEITDGHASGGGGSITPTVLVDVPALISGITSGGSASGDGITTISNTIVEQGITYRYNYSISPSQLFTLPSGINYITNITVPLELENRTPWTPVNTVKIVAEIYELTPYTGPNSTYSGIMFPINGVLPIVTSEIAITELNTSDIETETFVFNTNLDANKRYGINFSVKVPETIYPSLNSQSDIVLVRIQCIDAYTFRNSIPLVTNYAQKNNSNQIITISKNGSYNWTYAQAFYTNHLPILKVMGTSI
jgi:hypothetical protein